MKKTIGFIVSAGHLDIEWYQPMNSYRFWTMEIFEDLKKAAKRADYVTYVLDGQVFPLEEYLEVVPEDEPLMRELVCSGKLAIGPFYTQFDEWIPSAESMIRNCLYGKRKAQRLGGYMRAGYLPDNFGHPRQIPQILQGFGIDSLMFMRGMPEIPGGHPDEFVYEGLDGSKVMASHFRESYGGAFDIYGKDVDPNQPRDVPYYAGDLSFEHHRDLARHDDPEGIARDLISNVHKIKERYPSGVVALIAGADHLPPQINIGETVKIANEMQDEIEFVMGTAEEYVRLVQGRMNDPAVYNMELIGSRYQYILFGALSTRTYLKRQNFACEALLERYAEPLDAIASRYGYPDRPALLDEAWKHMMINSAHDSIHGSSTDEVHIEMETRFAKARQIAAGVIHGAMAHLGKHVHRWWENAEKGTDDKLLLKGILTYAPVSSGFEQCGELWLPIGETPVRIIDKDGNELPTQVLPREQPELNGKGQPRNDLFPDPIYRKVLFTKPFSAGTVETLAAVPGKHESFKLVEAGKNYLENEWLRVEVTGCTIQILDKRSGKWYRGLNVLQEDAEAGDAWDHSPPWTPGETVRSNEFPFTSRLIEQGSVRAVLEVSGAMHVPAFLCGDVRSTKRTELPVSYLITLWRGVPRVDVKLKLDNTAKDHRIRLCIPANLKTDHVLSQGHLAIMDRPIERVHPSEEWYQPPTQILPCREWLAVEDGKDGLAVAVKGLYDYEAVINSQSQEPDLYLTLLRGFELMGRRNTSQRAGSASDAIPTPGAQCLGVHEIEWSYLPYQTNTEEKAPFLSAAQDFLYPIVSHMIRSDPTGETVSSIPAAFGWNESNLQFSCFKQCMDRDGYLLRVFENQGRAVTAKIRIGDFQHAWLANLNEDALQTLEIVDGCVTVAVPPYKAVSIKLA